MTILGFVLYLTVGRLLVWFLQMAGLFRPVWALHPKLTELSECDLCLGFWIYLLLGVFWGGDVFLVWPRPLELVILSAVTAFVAHLLGLGWQAKFGVTVIE